MEELYFEVEKTRTGRPSIWVGGGSTSNRFSANFVLRKGKLAKSIFIKTSGHRCNGEQALVPLQEGDVVVSISGMRPASPENPVIGIHGWKIVEFESDDDGKLIAHTVHIDVDVSEIPPSVWQGCNVYHNRDGTYFVGK